MIKKAKNEAVEYHRLSRDEQEKRGILGRLVGVCADFNSATRNGRKYSEQLWENVFDSDIMKEKIANKVCYGELGHPTDREEIDIEKIAVCLAEQPTKDENGKLKAVFDILNTPNGKLLKALCDYGSTLGISSRGTGDLYTNEDGDEAVDPDTYNCECFDIVLIPAVKEARLQYVTESLDKKRHNKTLRQALTESLEKASDSDRKIMKEALDTLNIKLDESRVLTKAGPMAKQEEHKIIDHFVDEKGERHFKLDTGAWVTEKDVDSIEADAALAAPAEEPASDAPIDNVEAEEVVEESVDDDITPDEWARFVKRASKKGVAIEALNEIYDKLTNGEEEITEDDYSLDESLDLSNEADFEVYDELVHKLYNALKSAVKSFIPKGYSTSEIDDEDISKAASEAIERLFDHVDESLNEDECNNQDDCADKLDEGKDEKEVVDDKSKIVAEFQESLLKNKQLTEDNLSLQEKLSVCNAKVKQLEESLKKHKAAVAHLSESSKEVKELKEANNKLTEQLNVKDKNLSVNKEKFMKLAEDRRVKIDESDVKINKLSEEVKTLTEKLEDTNKKLVESSKNVKKLATALKEAKQLYVTAKAEACGLDVVNVKANLKESFKFKDVDSVCEALSDRMRNIQALPFRIDESVGIKVKASTTNNFKRESVNDDDFVSDSLLRMVNLK